MHARPFGSKNGVRLYQNPDGTWTELGKARRRAAYESTFKGGKDGKPSRAEKITRSMSDIASNAYKIVDKHGKEIEDLSTMSDADLKKKIARMRLEEDYSRLSSRDIDAGKQKTLDTLEVIGSAVAITGGIVAIGSAVYDIFSKIASIQPSVEIF